MKRISQWANQHVQLALGLAIGLYTILISLGLVWGMFLEAYGYHLPSYLSLIFGGLAAWLLFLPLKRKTKRGRKKSVNQRYIERRAVYFIINSCILILAISAGNAILEEDNTTAFDVFLVDNNDLTWSATTMSTSVVYGLQPIEKAKKKRKKRARRLKAKKRAVAKRLRDINGDKGQWGVFVVLAVLSTLASMALVVLVCMAICSSNPFFIILSILGFAGSIVGCIFAIIHAVRLRNDGALNSKTKRPPTNKNTLVLPKVVFWIGLAIIGLGVAAAVVGVVFSLLFPVFAGILVILAGLGMALGFSLQKNKGKSN